MQETTHDTVTQNTAKQAKLKGFDVPVGKRYLSMLKTRDHKVILVDEDEDKNWNESEDCHYSAPTQGELGTWLKDNHKIEVTARSSSRIGQISKYYEFMVDTKDSQCGSGGYTTVELAYEAGLMNALNRIK